MVSGEVQRGQIMQGLIQIVSEFPRAMGRSGGFLCREVMGFD